MAKRPPPSLFDDYYGQSNTAAASLWFVLPLVVAYEVGTFWYASDPLTRTEERVVAFTLLRDAFGVVGATARWMAPAAVVAILLSQAAIRREFTRPKPLVAGGMLIESAVMALPLLAVALVAAKFPLDATGLKHHVLFAVGAGIYEELLFRLIGFAAVSLVCVDFLGIRPQIGDWLAILLTAIAFAAYHYLGPESFAVPSFVFRTAAGVYFGWLMLSRGFGITVGCHVVYDIFIGFYLSGESVVN